MTAVVVKEGRGYLRDESGHAFSVPENQIAQEVSSGARPESPEEYERRAVARERGTLGQQALTVGEGALENATLGLGTVAATALGGEEYRQAAQERAEENPTARIVGQAAGAVLPMLVPGGQFTPGGALSRAGMALERSIGGGLARAGVGGAGSGLLGAATSRAISLGVAGGVEGAAYGLGGSLAESALEGTEWTAERALNGASKGALYGLAGGAVIGAGEAVVARAGRKLLDAMIGEGKTLRAAARDFADGRLISRATDDARVVSQITRAGDEPARLGEIAEKIRARGATDPASVKRAVMAEASEAAQATRTIAKSLDDAGARPSGQAILGDLEEQASKIAASGLESDVRMASRLKRELDPLRKRIELPGGEVANPSFTEALTLSSRLERLAASKPGPAGDAFREMGRAVSKRLDEVADEVVGEAWKVARRDAGDFGALRDAMKREPAQAVKGGLTPGLSGVGSTIASLVMGSTTPAAIVSGMLTGAGHKLIAERGSRALGWIAERVAGIERASIRSARRLAGIEKASLPVEVERQFSGFLVDQQLDHFSGVQDDVIRATTDPAYMITKVNAAIGPAALEQPEVAQAMAGRIVADYAYLRTQIPPPITSQGQTIQPQKDVPKTPAEQRRKVVSAAAALNSPSSVFDLLSTGRVDWAAIDALKARRPELWQDFRVKVALACAEAEASIPYARRVMLGTVFEFPSDPSMMPGVVPPTPSDTPNNPSGSAQGAPGKLKGAADALGTPNSTAIESSEAA